MSTARKTLYAAVGAGDVALERARSLSKRVTDLPGQIRTNAGNVYELPSKAMLLGSKSAERMTSAFRAATGRVQNTATGTRNRVANNYTDLTKRGERLVKRVQRSAPTKRAVEQTRTARSRVKAAATSVRNAAKADVEAVSAAAEKVVEQAG